MPDNLWIKCKGCGEILFRKELEKALHVCHVTHDQIKTIEKARKEKINISCEVCPHHLFLNRGDLKRLGPLAVMKPPLLTKGDQEKLWANLDKIDIIATDHAPHTLEEKYDQSAPKFGVPGLETVLPLMFNAVSQKLLSINRLIEMMVTTPRKVFKIPKQPNTFVLIDFAKRYKIRNNLFTKCGWTPFQGMEGRGEIMRVVIRGKTIYQFGKFTAKPQGKVIYPVK